MKTKIPSKKLSAKSAQSSITKSVGTTLGLSLRISRLAPDWEKINGLLPAIVQNMYTREVLMLGYMSKEALQKTIKTGKIWFWSRSKKRLWKKGEESGNTLTFQELKLDCDQDAILIRAIPNGPTCHTGQNSCFGEKRNDSNLYFLEYLLDFLTKRKKELPKNSYSADMFRAGLDRIIQKFGEEAVEVIIAAKNKNPQEFISETSDLLFSLLLLLTQKEIPLQKIIEELQKRHITH
jgi:phosphoribosyl-ATP pyrophosphohydrolase/phosphoribosyl-AMP cyclohydrolase